MKETYASNTCNFYLKTFTFTMKHTSCAYFKMIDSVDEIFLKTFEHDVLIPSRNNNGFA